MQKSKKCSKCGHVGPINTDFGQFRTFHRGRYQMRVQAQCYWCHGRTTPKPEPNNGTEIIMCGTDGYDIHVKNGDVTVNLPKTREALLPLYRSFYPKDKAGPHRSMKFMYDKLWRKTNAIGKSMSDPARTTTIRRTAATSGAIYASTSDAAD